MLEIIGLVFLIIVALLAFSEADCYGWSLILLVVFAVSAVLALPTCNDYVINHGGIRQVLLSNTVWYLAVGIAVAAGKWVLFHFKVATTLKDIRETYKQKPLSSNESKYYAFIRHVYETCPNLLKGQDMSMYYPSKSLCTESEMNKSLTPSAKYHSDRIGSWVLQWPLVLLDFIVTDFLLKICKWVARIFGQVFDRMGRYLIADATKGL